MNSYRTDLAVELKDLHSNNLDGVLVEEETACSLKISKVHIQTIQASERFGKPIGIYYTIDIPELKNTISMTDDEFEIISKKISEFLPKDDNETILVVGLGNREITPDSLGPRTIDRIISTRHVKSNENFIEQFKDLISVAAISPGVLGQTGIEIFEIIQSLINKINPSAIIVIDALVSQDVNRLGSTVQISNAGISPGSGVMNARKEISQNLLGIPVISIGIPTVVDAITLVGNILDTEINSEVKNKITPMIVTPKEIDNIIKNSSSILSLIINKSLQKKLSIDDIKSLIS